jgi:hypothetical protein
VVFVLKISPREAEMAAELRDTAPNLDGDNWHEAYNAICDYYRLALFNALYCGKRLGRAGAANLSLEVSIAILASVVAGLTALKDTLIGQFWLTVLAIAAAVLAAIKPVLRLSDSAAKYAGQHGGYKDIYLAYQDLVAFIRVEKRVTVAAWREHEALSKRYRALAVSSDPNPPAKFREALKAEVEQQIPLESLRIT